MQLIVDKRNTACVTSKLGVLTLGQALTALGNKSGMSPYIAGLDAYVQWPAAYTLQKDKNNSVKAFIRLIDSMGYEVVIKKKP